MKIGIIVAMRKELALLLPLLSNPSSESHDGLEFHTGTIGSNQVIAMQCGIAKVNAAIGTVTLINHYAPSLIINSGVAGGTDKSVNVMDIVVGSRVAYHDVWCGPESTYGAVQGLPLYYEADKHASQLVANDKTVKKGLIVSGDQFVDSIEQVKIIKSHFPDALAVDMESGAIAQVCELRNVPFMSMRVISDSPGASHDNTKQYNDFWDAPPAATFNVLHNLLLKI